MAQIFSGIHHIPNSLMPSVAKRRIETGMVACVAGLMLLVLSACGSQPDVSAAPMSTSAPIASHSRAIGTPVIDTAGLEIDGADTIDAYLDGEASVPALVLDQGVWDSVADLYTKNQSQPFWHDGDKWLPVAIETVQVIRQAARHGLLPSDYLPSGLSLPAYKASNAAAIIEVELTLTSGVLSYILDVQEGRYAPSKSLDPVSVFIEGAQADDYPAWLSGLTADHWIYRRMVNADGQHATLDGPDWDRYRVTMEKLRWDAPNLPVEGRYILANVGSAEVWAMDGLTLDLGANAVVGRATRQTPLRDDAIVSLKFSPDWTAPYSIIEKDLVKMAQENPAHVQAMGVEIYQAGQRVDPYSIDWFNVNVRRYVFKQPPGPMNVLGGVRFTLQNSQAIYLHDTPDKASFDADFRALSSGCIRVGAIDEFALWLMQGQDPSWTIEQVRAQMTQPTSRYEILDRKVPVKTIYTTAWVSHNGTLYTSPDTYRVNDQLRRQMGLPLELVGDSGLLPMQDMSDVF